MKIVLGATRGCIEMTIHIQVTEITTAMATVETGTVVGIAVIDNTTRNLDFITNKATPTLFL